MNFLPICATFYPPKTSSSGPVHSTGQADRRRIEHQLRGGGEGIRRRGRENAPVLRVPGSPGQDLEAGNPAEMLVAGRKR